MSSQASPDDSGPLNWLARLGALAIAAMACAVPLVVAPWMDTRRPNLLVAKAVALAIVGLVATVCGAVLLLARSGARWPGAPVPVAAVGVLAAVTALSAALSDDPMYSFRHAGPGLAAMGAAMFAPLLLRSRRAVAFVIGGALLAAAVGAGIMAASAADVRTFNRAIYGGDARDVAENAEMRERMARMVEGGFARGAILGTQGNPEYAGTYLAVAAALASVLALDIAPRSSRPRAAWLGAVALLLLILAALAASQTRGAWLGIGAAGLVRALLPSRVKGWVIALWLGASVSLAAALGALAGGAAFLLGAAGIGLRYVRSGGLAEFWRGATRPNRILFIAMPLLLGAMVAALSIPGPWNPLGARVASRLAAAFDPADRSVRERLVFYMMGSEQLAERPLLGHGPGMFGPKFYPALARLADRDDSGTLAYARQIMVERVPEFSHSDYVQLAAERGVAGLAAFLAAAAGVLAGLARIVRTHADAGLRALALACGCGIAASLTVSLFSGPLHFADRSALFWALMACAIALAAMERRGA